MAKMVYTPEMHEFLLANYRGISTSELTEGFNNHFGVKFSKARIKNYKNYRHLRSGAPRNQKKGTSRIFPKEVSDYIYANYKGVGPKEMAERLNKKFGTSYTKSQLKGFYGNHHLNSGITGRFEKGNVSHNKGKKGQCASGCEKTWFKKGHTPGNHKEVGTERTTIYGYIEVKVAEPNKWRAKHHVIWEQHNGLIPEKHVVCFRDGNKANFNISNLVLVHRANLAVLNKNGLGNCTEDRFDLALTYAETKRAITEAKRAKKGMVRT